LLPVHGSKSRLPIPKRAFTQEQLKSLRNDSSLPDDTARFTIHFLLTEEDFDYAKNATAPWIATGKGHIAARVVCGTSGLFFLLAPNLGVFTDVRGGWAGLWEASPAVAFGLATFCVLQIWMGLGAAGLKSLERHLNHYNEPRTYTFSDASITLKCGGRIRQKKWMNLLRFQETPNAFILYAQVFERVVIPKLALRGHDVDAFRDFLSSKLPCS